MAEAFTLHQELLNLHDANYSISNEIFVADLSKEELDEMLNVIEDKLGEDSYSITNEEIFDVIRSFVKLIMNRVFVIIFSGLKSEYDALIEDLNNDNEENFDDHKKTLEIYGFLLFWLITDVENKINSKIGVTGSLETTNVSAAKKTKSKSKQPRPKQSRPKSSSSVNANSYEWDWNCQKEEALSLMKKILATSIKNLIYEIISISVKDYNHGFDAKTYIIQNLQYYDFLSDSMAELLQVLVEQYDNTQLVEDVLIEISNKEFTSQDNNNVSKSFSKFLIKLSELIPNLVMKQISILVIQLDSESYIMRSCLMETLGNLITYLVNNEDDMQLNQSQVNSFFDALEERFLDVNALCRSRLLQAKFPKRRQTLTDLVVRSLEDKSCHVRRNSIKLLTTLITTHPYGVIHGGELKLSEWEERLSKIEEELKSIQAPPELQEINTEDDFARLQLTRRYYADAIRFINQIHTAIPTLCQLLASTTKSEVLETIVFFETAHTYKMEFASEGISKMLHLIWTNDNNDEGKGVKNRLVESYIKMYLETTEMISPAEKANQITKNLISLTINATLAELTSLEQLLSIIMNEKDAISEEVIAKLWSVYSTQKDIPKSRRRGAIIILSMLANGKIDIVKEKIDLLLKIGLGPLGKADLILAKKTVKLFDLKQHSDDDMEIDMAGEGEDSSTSEAFMRDPNQLSQLIFIAGHVAIKQIVHLEAIELEWKRQKVELGKHKSSTNSIDDELEQVTGTSEDDIYEVLMYIREQELLYGSDSLLSVFGPLVVHICSINKSYNNQMLQVVSTLTLTKFMCVSSKFCEDNLQLLFTILEKTNDPTIKCNIIIALGDMTVCFNNVIDQHINYLYNRLSDDNTLVKKNALMVLTHLILNGMIKAKDQLIEMHKCLGDDDQRISDLAKLFFSELETKDNAVYKH
ncbi:1237_t:CDS:10 [Entrophospora sp. SA101]|nr:1237_t:CDS:10 [Entrophospora sp. SA101]